MTRSFTEFVDAFDGGRISRRQLLALAAAAVVAPGSAFSQAPAPARGGRGPSPADMAPLVPPFAATGWKTVWLDHLSYQCADYKKAAAFYSTLMGWKVRSDDGKQAVLDIGENTGNIIIRGGLTGSAPAAITDDGLGVSRPPVRAIYDGFAWGITPWDTDKVKAELTKRGLNPVADHHGPDYQSFRIKDPDGFDLAITNGTRALRRKGPANAKLPAPAPFEPTGWNTLYLDHISFEVPDYRRSAAFYQALLGWTMTPGNGSSSVQIGSIAGAIIRGNAAVRASQANPAAAAPPPRPANSVTATIGHISFGIENWDTEKVRAALKKRDVVYVTKEGQREPRADMTGKSAMYPNGLESFHVPDAMGWDLQIGNKIAPV